MTSKKSDANVDKKPTESAEKHPDLDIAQKVGSGRGGVHPYNINSNTSDQKIEKTKSRKGQAGRYKE